MSRLTEDLISLGYNVYLVDEVGSSKEYKVPTTLLLKNIKNIPKELIKSDDIKAAVTLALRAGVKLSR